MRSIPLSMAVLVLLCALVASPDGQAQSCRDHDLFGTFGLLVTGTLIFPTEGGGTIPVPFVRLGAPSFDGAGKLGGTAFASVGGQVASDDFEGTYTVHPDCSVEFWAKVPFPPPNLVEFKMAGLLSENSTRMDFMTVEPSNMGVIFLGELQQQRRRECAVVDLRGAYELKLSGSDMGSTIARFGKLVTDGEGNFSGRTYLSKNGVITTEIIKGTYQASANCMFDMFYFQGSDLFLNDKKVHLKGALFGGGEGAYLMQIDPPGAAIGGTLARLPGSAGRRGR